MFPSVSQMAKNKGLTPKRKKIDRNPRVKHREKFRRAKIRRKGQVCVLKRRDYYCLLLLFIIVVVVVVLCLLAAVHHLFSSLVFVTRSDRCVVRRPSTAESFLVFVLESRRV